MQAEQLGGCRQGTGWELKHGALRGRARMGVESLHSWRNCLSHPTRSKETQKVLALSCPSLPQAQQLGKAVYSSWEMLRVGMRERRMLQHMLFVLLELHPC